MTMPWPPPPMIADQAHTTDQPGTCSLCPQGIVPGERIARLPTGEWVHTRCLA